MRPFVVALTLSGVLAGLAACAPVAPSPPPSPLDVAPATPQGGWRLKATTTDADRLSRLEGAWGQALGEARAQPGSGNLDTLGELIDPMAARPGVTPPSGDYRCRTVKLGSQGSTDGLGYVVYGWFACRTDQDTHGLTFIKTTGSQRPVGRLYPETDQSMVLLASLALSSEPTVDVYGQTPDRDVIAILERIGEERWRLVMPWPQAESTLDLIELIPAR